MDFQFQEDDVAAAQLARGILTDHATNERQKQLESSGATHDETLWRALADASLLGVAIPEEHGGSGLGLLALGLLLQEIGRAVAKVPAYPALALGALPLARFGSEAQKSALLPGIARGERIVTAALAEYESSDPLAPRVRATREGGAHRLHGVKAMVPAAQLASHVIVPARCDGGSIGLFLVEPAASGLTLAAQETSDGQPHAEMTLDGVRVDDTARLAHGHETTGGGDALRWLVERAIILRCMMQLGVVERALEMTAQYGRDRVQFDRPIGSFQAVAQRLADDYIDIKGLRLTLTQAAWRLSEDLPADVEVATAAFWAAEAGHRVAHTTVHVHGGVGIDKDHPVHRYFLTAKQTEFATGGATAQLRHIGRDLADTPA